MKIGLMIGRSHPEVGGVVHVINSIRNVLCQEHEVVTYTFAKVPGLENNKYIIPFPFARASLLQVAGNLLCRMARDCDVLVYPQVLFGFPHDGKRPIIIYSHAGFPAPNAVKHSWILRLYGRMFGRKHGDLIRHIKEGKNVDVLTNSQYTATVIRKDVDRESTVVYPGIDIERFKTKSKTRRSGVVSVGMISKHKHYEITCDVMTRIGSPYAIMGRIPSGERPYHDMLRARYPGVRLIPSASFREMRNRLWNTKVYLHARIEDFGISVVESIAAGCVPVVPDAGGIKETVPVSDLRYTPNDLNAMQEKVEKALAGEYDHHMPLLQKHVERYDISVFQKSFLDFVNSVCR